MLFDSDEIDSFIKVQAVASFLGFNVKKYGKIAFLFEKRTFFGFLEAAFDYNRFLLELRVYGMYYLEIVEVQRCLKSIYGVEFKVVQCFYNDLY